MPHSDEQNRYEEHRRKEKTIHPILAAFIVVVFLVVGIYLWLAGMMWLWEPIK